MQLEAGNISPYQSAVRQSAIYRSDKMNITCPPPIAQAVEKRPNLWETSAPAKPLQMFSEEGMHCLVFRPYCFVMTPKSVNPFTKNCTASATSSSPMIRTRIRIPVSPRILRTRSAPLKIP